MNNRPGYNSSNQAYGGGYSSTGTQGSGFYSSSNQTGFFSQPVPQPAYCPPPAQQITTSHSHGFFNPHYHQSNGCAPDPFHHDHHHGHHGHHGHHHGW